MFFKNLHNKLIFTNFVRKGYFFLQNCQFQVFEEMVNGEKLSEIINTRHENVKYLPGKILPDNIVSFTNF